jgi:hypothetical protein
LESNGRHVVLIDSNISNINKAQEMGLEAINTNIYSDKLTDNIELNDVGYLMALTGNTDINNYAINKFSKQFGENGAFRLVAPEEIGEGKSGPKEGLFSSTDDFNSLTEVATKYPSIHELSLTSKTQYSSLIEKTNKDKNSIPLFLKDKEGDLHIISAHSENIDKIEKGWQLVYLGKPINPNKT